MSEPRTGHVGERYCALLCAQAGLVVNGAIEDANGWDALVEFPDEVRGRPVTADTLHVAAPQCRVQVKTTAKAKRHEKIALSNLRLMATDPLPAFVLFVQHGAGGRIAATHLVHIDHDWITRILERVRRHTIGKGRKHKLHKHTMTVRASDADVLAPNDAGAFREALLVHIGPFDDYRRAKIRHAERTGFEDGSHMLEIRLAERDGETSLSDAMLGYGRRVRVERFSATLTRFGIRDPAPYVRQEGGWLELPDLKPTPATLMFRITPLAAPTPVAVRVYRTLYGEDVDAGMHRVRIVGPFLEHEFKPKLPGFYPMQLSLAPPMPLEDLGKALGLITRLGQDASRATATLEVDGVSGGPVIGLGATPAIELPPGGRAAVEHAMSIAKHFDSPPPGNVLFADLVEHRRTLSLLESVLDGTAKSVRVLLEDVRAPEHDRNMRTYAVVPCAAPLGRSLYVALLLVEARVVVPEGDGLTLYSSSFSVAGHLVLDRADIDWAGLEREMQAVGAPLDDDCNVFVIRNDSVT